MDEEPLEGLLLSWRGPSFSASGLISSRHKTHTEEVAEKLPERRIWLIVEAFHIAFVSENPELAL